MDFGDHGGGGGYLHPRTRGSKERLLVLSALRVPIIGSLVSILWVMTPPKRHGLWATRELWVIPPVPTPDGPKSMGYRKLWVIRRYGLWGVRLYYYCYYYSSSKPHRHHTKSNTVPLHPSATASFQSNDWSQGNHKKRKGGDKGDPPTTQASSAVARSSRPRVASRAQGTRAAKIR